LEKLKAQNSYKNKEGIQMSAKIYPFPTIEDQQVIKTAIELFLAAQTGITRERMLKTIRTVLDRYHISCFSFPDFTVEATKTPGYSIIRARKFVNGRTCPSCGEQLYGLKSGVRILSIQERRDYHVVTYGCRCGKVFAKCEEI
jgi:ribosomal protein L34E